MFTGNFIWGWVPMVKITVKPDKNFPQSLLRHLDTMIHAACLEAVDIISLKISAGVRTGRHYRKYPRRSSKVGEYPQEQFSFLKNSVEAVKRGRGFYSVGFFGDDPIKLLQLEYGTLTVSNNQPMNRGYFKGQRKPLYRVFIGVDGKMTRKAMNAAAQAVA
jgi:hypothetical protein